jgi:thiamine-phosphate pyrophosphorylase
MGVLKRTATQGALPAIILMTDEHAPISPETVIPWLPRGGAVILRHYGEPARLTMARRLQVICRKHRLRLLIAGDARLAVAVRADGLHLPEYLARNGDRRWQLWRRQGWLVTAAAHSPRAVRRALAAGIHAVLVSPVFATASHREAKPLGPLKFARLARLAPLPVYALGGITERRFRRLSGAGAAGWATVRGLSPHVRGPAAQASPSSRA